MEVGRAPRRRVSPAAAAAAVPSLLLFAVLFAFRALGFGFGLSSVSAALINGALGSKCRPLQTVTTQACCLLARFVPDKFEEIFAKHAKTVPDALTSDEIDQLLQANREPGDYSGWAGAEAEWKTLYSLGKDKDGLLRKDVARSVYDGTLFHMLAPNWKSPDEEEEQELSVIRES
ncbi:putative peroxygenase 4 [Zea mays]|uniref:Putative peroxygenase 4 n=1 Tax=Zea mays TaxID=4577 RepID=A0A1D6HJI2_MAIZE|nr:putative peroxygenase 4 [Zea mays]